jgi:hypothetical protein
MPSPKNTSPLVPGVGPCVCVRSSVTFFPGRPSERHLSESTVVSVSPGKRMAERKAWGLFGDRRSQPEAGVGKGKCDALEEGRLQPKKFAVLTLDL